MPTDEEARSAFDVPLEYRLSPGEQAELRRTVDRLTADGADPRRPAFFDGIADRHGLLPEGPARFLAAFRRERPACAALVHGLPVGPVPPTPATWAQAGSGDTPAPDVLLALVGLTLGEPFGWETLQAGSLVQNVFPVRGEELAQSGGGSTAFLEFHTEDAFHPQRPDHLLLLCLRNEDEVPTVLSSVRDVRLPDRARRVLAQRRFAILPDTEHLRQLTERQPDHPALERVRRMIDDPEPAGVLVGSAPDIRFDRPFMRPLAPDAEAEAALDLLATQLELVQQQVVVGPGSLLVVDNHLAVHGRGSFRPRYDGTDRWLKKLLVRRELPGAGSPRVLV